MQTTGKRVSALNAFLPSCILSKLLTTSMAMFLGLYRFTLIDLGGVGRHSDGGIFSHSGFGQDLENGSLVLPNPAPLPRISSPDVPFVFVGDEAFPSRIYFMRPYPGQSLNGKLIVYPYCVAIYQLEVNNIISCAPNFSVDNRAVYSRDRRIIENTFEILAAR